MRDEDLTFEIEERNSHYCDSCQQLGEAGPAGLKTHRSIPLDTVSVKTTVDDERFFLTMCGDCLAVAKNVGLLY
jgi:hypothetical protein